MTAAELPRVAVVVVTYNSESVIAGCLEALTAALEGLTVVSVVVADNSSADDTITRARAAYPAVTIVETGGNLGYSAAINRGRAAAAEHELLLILNPDTVATPGSIAALASALQSPDRGMAVPKLIAPDGLPSRNLRREPTLRRALAEAILGGARAARRGWGEVVADQSAYEQAGPTDWATGAAVLISQRCWSAIGEWDESFFLYSEETDYMLRARDTGLSTWYVPQAVVSHRGGESSTSPQLWSVMLSNKVRLFAKRRGSAAATVYRLILVVSEGIRALTGRPRSKAALSALIRPGQANGLPRA